MIYDSKQLHPKQVYEAEWTLECALAWEAYDESVTYRYCHGSFPQDVWLADAVDEAILKVMASQHLFGPCRRALERGMARQTAAKWAIVGLANPGSLVECEFVRGRIGELNLLHGTAVAVPAELEMRICDLGGEGADERLELLRYTDYDAFLRVVASLIRNTKTFAGADSLKKKWLEETDRSLQIDMELFRLACICEHQKDPFLVGHFSFIKLKLSLAPLPTTLSLTCNATV